MGKFSKYFVLSITSLLFLLCFSYQAKASDFSWLDNQPTAAINKNLASPYENSQCTQKQVPIGSIFGEKATICVYKAKDFYYGLYEKFTPVWPNGYWERSTVIGFPGDTAMYKVRGLPEADLPLYTPNSSALIYRYPLGWSTWGYYAYTIHDFPSKLTRHYIDNSAFSMEYELEPSAKEVFLPDENASPTMIRSIGVSSNSKWLVTELRPGGLLRENLETGEKKWFSDLNPRYGQGSDPTIEFAISDDGNYVAVAGVNMETRIYELNDNCGKQVDIFYSEWRSLPPSIQPCSSSVITDAISTAIGGDLRFVRYPQFNFDSSELNVYTIPVQRPDTPYQEKWVTLHTGGKVAKTLDYLALGDSYSSGEGDTEKDPNTGKKYYRKYTDQEADPVKGLLREKCHVSTRSYPYLLADVQSLAIDHQWNSVACGGAYINDIGGRNDDYRGQGDRLADLGEKSSIEAYKAEALNEFIPGREQQIKFVEKYKPKVITLTAGGNDVNFGDILQTCLDLTRELSSTCSYASKNDKKRLLSEAIRLQFKNLRELYTKLHNASDREAKIYVFGYPQIVNDDPTAECGLNVQLTNQERTLVHEGIGYMNDIIEAASRSAGVRYIDIEDSFKGHRLCDSGQKAATGVTLFWGNDSHESFHPNAYGHSLIGAAFLKQLHNQSPQAYSWCPGPTATICPDSTVGEPAIPAYFKEAYDTDARSSAYTNLTGDIVLFKKGTFTIKIPEFILRPSSIVTAVIHSDPISLGTLNTDKTGGLEGKLLISQDVSPGFHTLILSGQTFSGEDIDLWQIVEVQGADPNDRDEDGIPDTQDSCMYVQAANKDEDKDGVDDACDPFIGDPKEIEQESAALLSELKQKYTAANNKTSVVKSNDQKAEAKPPLNDGSTVPSPNPKVEQNNSNSTYETRSIIQAIWVGIGMIGLGVIVYIFIRRFKT